MFFHSFINEWCYYATINHCYVVCTTGYSSFKVIHCLLSFVSDNDLLGWPWIYAILIFEPAQCCNGNIKSISYFERITSSFPSWYHVYMAKCNVSHLSSMWCTYLLSPAFITSVVTSEGGGGLPNWRNCKIRGLRFVKIKVKLPKCRTDNFGLKFSVYQAGSLWNTLPDRSHQNLSTIQWV